MVSASGYCFLFWLFLLVNVFAYPSYNSHELGRGTELVRESSLGTDLSHYIVDRSCEKHTLSRRPSLSSRLHLFNRVTMPRKYWTLGRVDSFDGNSGFAPIFANFTSNLTQGVNSIWKYQEVHFNTQYKYMYLHGLQV